MNGWAHLLVALLTFLVATTVGDLVSEEVRSRLDRLPMWLLEIALKTYPVEERATRLDEFRGDLSDALELHRQPITRLVIGIHFAVGVVNATAVINPIKGSLRLWLRALASGLLVSSLLTLTALVAIMTWAVRHDARLVVCCVGVCVSLLAISLKLLPVKRVELMTTMSWLGLSVSAVGLAMPFDDWLRSLLAVVSMGAATGVIIRYLQPRTNPVITSLAIGSLPVFLAILAAWAVYEADVVPRITYSVLTLILTCLAAKCVRDALRFLAIARRFSPVG